MKICHCGGIFQQNQFDFWNEFIARISLERAFGSVFIKLVKTTGTA